MRGEAVVRLGDRELHLLGTVRGLVREAERVSRAFDRLAPEALALGVGPEDLEGLEKLEGGAAFEHEYSESDEVYAQYLEQFGPVQLPPLDLVEALRRGRAAGIPVVAVDLPEVAYVDAFTKEISGWQLLRYNRRVRKLARKPPAAEDALDFHLWWDAQFRRLAGFDALERAREAHMAARLRADPALRGRVLVVLEAARVEGVVAGLSQPTDTLRH